MLGNLECGLKVCRGGGEDGLLGDPGLAHFSAGKYQTLGWKLLLARKMSGGGYMAMRFSLNDSLRMAFPFDILSMKVCLQLEKLGTHRRAEP